MPATYSSSSWTKNPKLVQLVAAVYKRHKDVVRSVSACITHARALRSVSVRSQVKSAHTRCCALVQKYKNTIEDLGNQFGVLIHHGVLKRAVRHTQHTHTLSSALARKGSLLCADRMRALLCDRSLLLMLRSRRMRADRTCR
jgi:hypothetical protein